VYQLAVSGKNKDRKMKLSVPSRTEELLVVRKFISDAAKSFGFSDGEVGEIALAVDEACTNIIKHAYNYATDGEINVVIYMHHPEFEVLIQDNGKNFNPELVSLPDMKEYLTHYKRGGLGMYLMKKLMDKVEYRIQPHRNIVRLVKYLS
jgi:serine/threonine-protein kinase RsbW